MCRLIESIKVYNKQFQQVEFHNRRFNFSRNELFGLHENLDLTEIVKIPSGINRGIVKCRIVYDSDILSVEFIPYIKKEIKSIKLVTQNNLDYRHKFLDRHAFTDLLAASGADEILIIKKGRITDTTFSNIVFFDGKKWITPLEPLLKGTKRAFLLETGQIVEDDIQLMDLKNFSCFRLINAMLDFENDREFGLPMSLIG